MDNKRERNQRMEAMKNKPIFTVIVIEKPSKNSICSKARSSITLEERENSKRGVKNKDVLLFSKPPNFILPRNDSFSR